MKITVLVPKSEFSLKQQKKLANLGEVVYTDSRREYPIGELVNIAGGSEILAADPDNLGGFEKAKSKLTVLMESLPKLKGVALASSASEWIDLGYCQKRGIVVTNVPGYSTESVAEHALGLMICLAKKIIVNDRKSQADGDSKYDLGMGFELKGKTLGIIGLGSIGSRIAQLGQAIGMRVMAYNRSPKRQAGVNLKTLNEVLSGSDILSINLACDAETYHFISTEELERVKKGVIMVDLIGPVPADKEVVDKKALATALKSGKVAAFAYEAEDLDNNPLSGIENAIGLKGFAWYTRDALDRAKAIWTDSIVSIASGKAINVVEK